MAKSSLRSVGIKELKDQASAIIESIQKSRRPVVITKNSREIAKLVPITASESSLSERLMELGLLSSAAQGRLQDVRLEKVGMDASIAIASIIADRDED